MGADSVWWGEPPGDTIRSIIVQDPEGGYVQFDQRVCDSSDSSRARTVRLRRDDSGTLRPVVTTDDRVDLEPVAFVAAPHVPPARRGCAAAPDP